MLDSAPSVGFICSNSDVDETVKDEPEFHPGKGVRDASLNLWGLAMWGRSYQCAKLKDKICLLLYGIEHPSRRKRTLMDIDDSVRRWTDTIAALTTAHTKEELDKAEFGLDELLSPILTAPVAQLRTFYKRLCASLEADKRVPFFVYQIIVAWGSDIDKVEKDEIVALKTQLANEVAQLVENDVKSDLMQALVGALQWRSAESLTEIKTAVTKGEKPRLKGRESCLFLVAGGAEVML